jgi:Cu+-exporting ATPase
MANDSRAPGGHAVARRALATPQARDPVCGLTVPAGGPLRAVHRGRTYVFCQPPCLERFRADPLAFADDPVPLPRPASTATGQWTCPLHPEVVGERPAPCPLCGVALEPRGVQERPPRELLALDHRLRVSAIFTVPLLILAAGISGAAAEGIWLWVQLVLASPVVLWGGWPFFVRGWRSLVRGRMSMFTLIALAVAIAYLHSVAVTLGARLFPGFYRAAGEARGVYFSSAASMVTVLLLGQVLELRARVRAGAALRALLGGAPAQARRLGPDGGEDDVPLAELRPGDRLRVPPGEKIPADGMVVEGQSAVDESLLGGEPLEKTPGAPVLAGSINGSGSLVIRAERIGGQTLLGQMARLVTEAQRPIQRTADLVAGLFVPLVVVAAAATFFGWALVGPGPEPRLALAVAHAVAVLIVASPGALALASPLAVAVATARGARAGVLFRDARAIETLRRADTLVLGKTGILTEGRPRLRSVVPTGAVKDGRDLLRLAATLEQAIDHPFAAAIVQGAAERDISLGIADQLVAVPGKGVKGTVEGRAVSVGTERLMEEDWVDVTMVLSAADGLRAEGQTVMFVAVDGQATGLLGVADPLAPGAQEALAALRAEGLHLVMLTGDGYPTAAALAGKLGIDQVKAEVLRQDRPAAIKALRAEGRLVAVAGDAIDEASVLAEADLAVAMGAQAGVTIDSVAVTLVKGDLRALLRARRLSRLTMSKIRQNLFLAFAYNALGIPLAAGVLHLLCGVLLNPALAAAAMAASSLSVIASSLRLRRTTL